MQPMPSLNASSAKNMVKVKVFDSKEATSRKRVAAEAPQHDAAGFHAVVEARRSVRIYADEEVPEDVMRRCLASAQLAPNSSNLQVWEAHWVRNPDQRRELARICMGQPAAVTAPELVVFVARPDRWREHNEWMIRRLKSDPKTPAKGLQYFEKITKLVYTLGPWGVFRPFKWVWFTVRGWSTPTPREPLSLAQLATWAHKSTALACAHYMLALRAEGFDSCPMEGFDAWRVRRLLGLPRGAKVTMVISAGRRAEGGVYGPRFRFDLDTFVKEHV